MASSASEPHLLLRAAHVRRAHGIRGEVRVEAIGGDASRFRPGLRLRRESDGAELSVRAARSVAGGEVLLSFEGVRSRDDAERLRDEYLCVEPEEARALGDDEWFVHDLVGLEARTPAGEPAGTVTAVEHYVGNDVLVLRTASGERRLPMTREFVQAIDTRAGSVVVTPWPEEEGPA